MKQNEMTKLKQPNMARELRRKQSEAERKLWAKLRNEQVEGVKFRRQEPIGNYIVDFVSFNKGLIIEIDGGQHNDERAIEADTQRTRWLEDKGFHVIRFWNNDVLRNTDGVLTMILEALK